MNTLQFQKALRQGSSNKQERHYLDFIISGQSLRNILPLKESDFITPFGLSDNDAYERQLQQVFTFEKKSELDSGRIMLYICPECGDIGCGAITATIQDLDDKIVWKDFCYETKLKEEMECFPDIEPLEFDRQSYFQTFSKLQ